MKSAVTGSLVAAALFAFAGPGFAADQGRTSDAPAVTTEGVAGDQENFGTANTSTVAISAYDFEPFRQTGAVTGVNDDGNGFSWATGGSNKLFIAGFNLPSGVEIERAGIWYCDTSAAGSFLMTLYQINANGSFTTITSTTFADAACGVAINGADLNYNLNTQNGSNVQMYLFQQGTAVAGEVKFRGAEVRYRLRVSPAPATATFADVPVGSGFHRFVEALASAGVTGGCGGGNYCPNDPITRGQMAVFLSAALGLNFPN